MDSSTSIKYGTYIDHMIHHLSQYFKVTGSRVKVTVSKIGAKICRFLNNSARSCSIAMKLTTDYDQVTPDLPQTVKVNESNVKVIA